VVAAVDASYAVAIAAVAAAVLRTVAIGFVSLTIVD